MPYRTNQELPDNVKTRSRATRKTSIAKLSITRGASTRIRPSGAAMNRSRSSPIRWPGPQ